MRNIKPPSVIYSGIYMRAASVLKIETSPSSAGRSPQRGWVGVGVSDIVHELKFLFFNGFVVLIPNLSLLRKQCLSLRELSQSQRVEGLIRRIANSAWPAFPPVPNKQPAQVGYS